jgi:hypothetical protein
MTFTYTILQTRHKVGKLRIVSVSNQDLQQILNVHAEQINFFKVKIRHRRKFSLCSKTHFLQNDTLRRLEKSMPQPKFDKMVRFQIKTPK